MSFDFFGRSFHFLADDMQREKAWNMLMQYVFKPQILVVIIVLLVYLILRLASKHKNKEFNMLLRKVSPWVYLFLIVSITILNREIGLREIRLYHDNWITASGFHESNVLGFLFNLFLYVPFGFLVYKWGFKTRKILFTIFFVILSSFTIEIMQYIFARGVTAIDDFASNVIGGLIGLGIAILLKRFSCKKQEVN